MGQENSLPPRTLSSRSIPAVAEFIQTGRPKCIVVMTGAGISTKAGIPDFRSPDTGLYANLARLDLPHPEAVFDISFFRENPNPFYVLAKELYPGKFYPTVSHSFISLLNKKKTLKMLFTQNIDCLERQAGVPADKIIEAHGSFASQRCIDCKTEYPDDQMKVAVEKGDVPHCMVPQCNGLVKPDIVFFGEALPESFHSNRNIPVMADLVIVMGTSLSVHPFASLPTQARDGVPRVLINKEIVGDFGSRPDDVVVLGDCDEGVRKLADALGWREELEEMWLEVAGNTKENEAERSRELMNGMTKDELLTAEIEKLTMEVDETLKVHEEHEAWVKKLLNQTGGKNSSSSTPEGEKLDEFAVGLKEPAADNTPANTEIFPINVPENDNSTVLDATLPQKRPDTESKPTSHI
ncbi:NAD-dependent deacetylase sirtuin-2 [Diplocarpon rosae]|nr:NAD-dependent deacetylase sirtuin-2 [Diplocarpon rosae]